jgi:release factor glutamine methyltransferase
MAENLPATRRALLAAARTRLAEAGIDDAALDARVLVEQLAGVSRTELVTRPDRPVEGDAARAVMAAVARRAAREPVHRILGFREFHGLRLALSRETLEPRPDTETLVDAMIPPLREIARTQGECRILDLGTGTGAIALALLAAIPRATAVGVDISREALETASSNAAALGLAQRFEPLQSAWFAVVSGKFHGIVSNPPYIPADDLDGLQPEVRLHDPHAALLGGKDGIEAYRVIAAGADRHLLPGGTIGLEIGSSQRVAVETLFDAAGFRLVSAMRDLGGNDRALILKRSAEIEITLGKPDEQR